MSIDWERGASKVLDSYYRDPHVRRRMRGFLGVPEITAVYLTVLNGADELHWRAHPPQSLFALLKGQADLARSLWDRAYLLADLDIEYVNFDFPGECYLNPHHSFELQRPVEEAVQEVLLELGIAPLHLMSGRGHHFLWKIRRESTAFQRLVKLAPQPGYIGGLYDEARPPHDEPVGPALGQAHHALGLVLEYVAHEVRRRAAHACALPVGLTAVECRAGGTGREMVSVDLSEYGDPLHTRVVRLPFSVYLKPWQERARVGQDLLHAMPPLFMIPRHELGLRESLDVMRSPEQTADLARRAVAQIPCCTAATGTALTLYESSHLAGFHRRFYAEIHEAPARWPETYDAFRLDVLPPCVRYILEHPNDLLMRPGGIQQVTRALMALGWHPRHIAGLIRSKYERDLGWGRRWYVYSAGLRADFYVRLFAGDIEMGGDTLTDFTCLATQERGLCFNPVSGCRLHELRQALSARRTNE